MLKVARKALIKVTHNKELKVLRSGIISVHLWFSYKCCKKVNSYQNACIVSVCGIPRPTLHSFGMSRASDSRGRSENWARLRGTFISFQYFPVTGSTLWPFCTTSHRIGSQTPGKKCFQFSSTAFWLKKLMISCDTRTLHRNGLYKTICDWSFIKTLDLLVFDSMHNASVHERLLLQTVMLRSNQLSFSSHDVGYEWMNVASKTK